MKKLLSIAALGFTLGFVLACSDEIVAQENQPATAIPMPPRTSTPSTQERIPQVPPRAPAADAGAKPAPFGCIVQTEVEPNETEDAAVVLPPIACGSLASKDDVDVYAAKSAGEQQSLSFEAEGDAELTLSGFGFERTITAGQAIDIPSFGRELAFFVTVHSPANALQSYRIVTK